MSKIQTIKIENFKAISELEANFKGCTAIVTGGNNKGKTSFLRGIPDRIRFVRPEVMVKQGSTKGKGEMTLDTGERFIWEFNSEGKDTLSLITKEGAKRSVTVALGQQFFPQPFDIDKFLQSTPKEQAKQLQKIIGIDFTDIDKRYAEAYQLRTDKNRESEKHHVKLTEMMEVPKVDFVDLASLQAKKEQVRQSLNAEYLKKKAHNDELRNKYQSELAAYNADAAYHSTRLRKVTDAIESLKESGYTGSEVDKFFDSIKTFDKVAPVEPAYIPEMPDDKALKEIDQQIFDAVQINTEAQAYKDYIEYKAKTESARLEAEAANDLVKQIEAERAQLIASANFPKGIAITHDGITVDGFPLDRNQISTSKLYTTALRIAAMNVGEVRTLFFDASYLDKNSLAEIQEWANSEDLQLLIERPDFDGGEITYQLVEN